MTRMPMTRSWPLLLVLAPLLLGAARPAPPAPFEGLVWGECQPGVTVRFARRMKLIDTDRDSGWPYFRGKFAGVDGCEIRPYLGNALLEFVDIGFWPASPTDVPVSWLWMCRHLSDRYGPGVQYTEGWRQKNGEVRYKTYGGLQLPVPLAMAPRSARAVANQDLSLAAKWRLPGGNMLELATSAKQADGRDGPLRLAARYAPMKPPQVTIHPKGERSHGDTWAASPPPGRR